MTRIKYDNNSIKYISIFESLTQAKLKDCIVNNNHIMFIVHQNQAAQAIGRNGINVRRIERILNRKIKIVEFNSNLLRFVSNLLYPLGFTISRREDDLLIKADTKTKALLIGRNSQNINNITSIIKRYFKVNNIRIL